MTIRTLSTSKVGAIFSLKELDGIFATRTAPSGSAAKGVDANLAIVAKTGAQTAADGDTDHEEYRKVPHSVHFVCSTSSFCARLMSRTTVFSLIYRI